MICYLIKLPNPNIIPINKPLATAAFLLLGPNDPVCIRLDTITAEDPARKPVPTVKPALFSLNFVTGSICDGNSSMLTTVSGSFSLQFQKLVGSTSTNSIKRSLESILKGRGLLSFQAAYSNDTKLDNAIIQLVKQECFVDSVKNRDSGLRPFLMRARIVNASKHLRGHFSIDEASTCRGCRKRSECPVYAKSVDSSPQSDPPLAYLGRVLFGVYQIGESLPISESDHASADYLTLRLSEYLASNPVESQPLRVATETEARKLLKPAKRDTRPERPAWIEPLLPQAKDDDDGWVEEDGCLPAEPIPVIDEQRTLTPRQLFAAIQFERKFQQRKSEDITIEAVCSLDRLLAVDEQAKRGVLLYKAHELLPQSMRMQNQSSGLWDLTKGRAELPFLSGVPGEVVDLPVEPAAPKKLLETTRKEIADDKRETFKISGEDFKFRKWNKSPEPVHGAEAVHGAEPVHAAQDAEPVHGAEPHAAHDATPAGMVTKSGIFFPAQKVERVAAKDSQLRGVSTPRLERTVPKGLAKYVKVSIDSSKGMTEKAREEEERSRAALARFVKTYS